MKKNILLYAILMCLTITQMIAQTFNEVENNNSVANAISSAQTRIHMSANYQGTVTSTDSDFWIISRKVTQATDMFLYLDRLWVNSNPNFDFRIWEYRGGNWGVTPVNIGTMRTLMQSSGIYDYSVRLPYSNNVSGGNSNNYYAIEVITSATSFNYNFNLKANSLNSLYYCYEFGIATPSPKQVNDTDVTLNTLGTNSFDDVYYIVKFSRTNSFTDFTDHYIQNQSLPNVAVNNSYSGSGEHVVYVGTDNGALESVLTMTNLQRNTTYYYKVYTYSDCQGYINYNNTSTPVSITTCPGTLPGVGSINSVTATSPTTATINTLGRPVGADTSIGYLVKFSDTNSFSAPVSGTSIPAASLDYSGKTGEQVVYTGQVGSAAGTTDNINQVITGLQINKAYYVKVYTYDLCGGKYNFETTGSTVVTTNYVCEAPSAVTNVTASATGANTLSITSFTAPSIVNGALGYIVKVSDVNSFTAPNAVPGAASTVYNSATGGEQVMYIGSSANPNLNITGLTANGTYYVKVYTYNTCAGGDYFETTGSTPVTIKTCGIPSGNAQLLSFREDLTYENRLSPILSNVPADAEGQVVKINVENSFTDITGVQSSLPTANVNYSGSGEQVILVGTFPNGQAFTGHNLLPNTEYFFKTYSYRVCNGQYYFSNTGHSTSKFTAGVTDKLASNAVINNFTGTGFTLASFTGAPIADNGRGAAKGYIVKMNTVNSFTPYGFRGPLPTSDADYKGGEQVMYIGASTTPNLVITGLTSGTTYYFTIYAYTDSGAPYFFKSYQQTGYEFSKVNNGALINPTITFNDMAVNAGGTNFNLNATSNSTGAITYRILNDGGTGTTLSGTNNETVNIGNAGTVIIEASQAATATYQSTTETMTLTINAPLATLGGGIYYLVNSGVTTVDMTTTLNSNSTGAYTFEIIGETLGHSISGNLLNTSDVAGSIIIKVTQAADANYSETVAYYSTLFFNTGFSPKTDLAHNLFDFSLNPGETKTIETALNFSGQPTTYTIIDNGGTGSSMDGNVFTAGSSAGTVTLRAFTSDNSLYNATTKDVTVTVIGAPQTITFNALSDVIYGDAAFNLTATASSGLTVTYTSSDPTIVSITGNTVTILKEGTINITASQAGGGSYSAAPNVVQSLTVNAIVIANQNVTLDTTGSVMCNTHATISLDNSQASVHYYLRNNQDDSIIEGPIAGTGSGITFTKEILTANRTYNIIGVQDNQTLPSATNTLQMLQTPTASIQLLEEKTINISQPNGQLAIVSVANSQTGVSYYLQDNVSNEVLQGPVVGTGTDFSFTTEAISADRIYKVVATDANSNNGVRHSLSLDNVDDYVSISAINSHLTSSSQATIETWVKIPASDATDVNASIISFESYAGTGIASVVVPLYINISGGTIFAGHHDNDVDDGGTFNTPSYTYPVNTWFHVAATINGSSVNFYVNGNLIGTTSTYYGFETFDLTSNIRIGRNYENTSTSDKLFGGEIAQTRVWNGIRTQTEITSSMNTVYTTSETNLVLNYNYNQASGTNITDDSSNSNTGTLQNASGDDTNWKKSLLTDSVCGFVAMSNSVTAVYTMNTITMSIKAFLQGAASNPNTGEESFMRDDLRVGGLLPTTSPYSDALTTDISVFNTTGSNAIVDWIWIELRDAIDGSVVVDGKSGLLQRDGDIVGIDGVSPINFTQTAGNYFIVIKHRNHLSVQSINTHNLSASNTSIDYSSDNTSLKGTANAVINMGNGIFAIPVGDQDDNGQIQNADVSAVIQLLGGSGYNKADMDMNGQIQNTDINTLLNPNIGKGKQF
ncbi:exported protein of unknown function [Tenacibaculum sp. 190130A14a]|uniref:Fibronectin type-III domain-containing protein n=1 Tax=Tenacibaculum polynesiense TaxID=3137857 RepID=A0ABP1F723_9FLAO